MSIKSAPFYWLVCDECGRKSTEECEYDAWADEGQALDSAQDSEWYVGNGRHFCFDHHPRNEEEDGE